MGWGGEVVGGGESRGRTQVPPPHLSQAPVCSAVGALLLTSASFQSPGMQKDSSRSLPHSSKIRSSGEGDRVGTGVSGGLENIQLSASPLINTEASHSWASSTQLHQAPLHRGVCSVDNFAWLGHLQTTLMPLWEEFLMQGWAGLGLPGTEGFLGQRSFPAKPGGLLIPREMEPAMWLV